jgi:ABC-type Mn2+/Zn2+ transport system permease subunit
MIQDFLHTWPLFAHTYLTGWLLAVLLSLLGVYVVARDQIFVGAAIAQASTLGIALSMVAASCLSAFHLHALEFGATTWAVVFACLAAYVMSLAFGRRESHEAVAAWIFLAGGSLSVLVVAHSPHGLDEIQRLVSSSLIGATAHDTVLFALLTSLTILMLLRHHRTITLLAVDPPMAAATGLPLRRWTTGLALWLGLAVGCSIRSAGLLYTFGSLVLPALTAKALAREIRPLFLLAPLLALVTAGAGFMLAHHFDFPPAQATVGLQVALLAVCWLIRREK